MKEKGIERNIKMMEREKKKKQTKKERKHRNQKE